MKMQLQMPVMFRRLRFLLYCFAVFIGVAGLVEGGLPLAKYAYERLQGKYFDAYVILSAYDRFSSEVILILSLMLLIVVHIGHVLAGGLRFTKSDKPAPPRIQSGEPTTTWPEKSNLSPSGSDLKPSTTDTASANEKLAHLIKPPADTPRP